MRYILLASALFLATPAGAAVGPLINGNQINPATAITIATMNVTGADGLNVAGPATISSVTATGAGFKGAGTALTGTAAGLTAGNVTTNANLTGPITSVGNATTIAGPIPTATVDLSTVTAALALKASTGGCTLPNLLITLNSGSVVCAQPSNVTGNAATVTTNANLTGDVTSVGNATTLTNAPVIAKVLTGYVSGAGTVSATDSILQAIQKLNGNDSTNANLTGPITSVGNATTIVGPVPNATVDLSTVTTALALKAPLANPTFTGTVNSGAHTLSAGTNLTVSGGGELLGLPGTPSGATAATSKSYVDALVVAASTGIGLQPTTPGVAQTGNMNISGTGILGTALGVGVGVAGTKMHMSSGTLTIDGNTAKSITALGSVSVATNAISQTAGAGSVLLQVGGSFPKVLITLNESTKTAVEFSPYAGNPWMRMSQGDGANIASGYLYAPGNFSVGMAAGAYYAAPNGYYLGRNQNYPSWFASLSSGDSGASGSSYGQADRYDVSRASGSVSGDVAGNLTPQPYLSIVGAGTTGVPGLNTAPVVRIPGGINANAAYVNDMFNVGDSSFTVKYDGTIGLGTSVGSGTQLFYCAGGTFTGNVCRGAACLCTGGTATPLLLYVR